MQDLLTYATKGLSAVTTQLREEGRRVPDEINRRMSERSVLDEQKSFGLFYIRERIQLCYGEGYGVHVESTLGEGTRVTITLPLDQRPKKFDEE